jgi:hypothetical protein
MSIIALFAPALFDVLDLSRPEMLCAFQTAENHGIPTQVRVIDTESEISANGQFTVEIVLGNEALHGRVAPYDKSEARDVVMRVTAGDNSVYLIALRDDGTALMRVKPAGEEAEVVTSKGSCSDFERHLDRWLSS